MEPFADLSYVCEVSLCCFVFRSMKEQLNIRILRWSLVKPDKSLLIESSAFFFVDIIRIIFSLLKLLFVVFSSCFSKVSGKWKNFCIIMNFCLWFFRNKLESNCLNQKFLITYLINIDETVTIKTAKTQIKSVFFYLYLVDYMLFAIFHEQNDF